MRKGRIEAAGVSARRRCKRSLTPSPLRGKKRSLPDHHRRRTGHRQKGTVRKIKHKLLHGMARQGSTRLCAPRGIRQAAAASNASSVIKASGHECRGVSWAPHGQPSRLAGRPQPARPEFRRRAAQSGLARPASPARQPGKGGSIRPPCAISSPAKSPAGRCVTTRGRNSPSRP